MRRHAFPFAGKRAEVTRRTRRHDRNLSVDDASIQFLKVSAAR
jgi:hypothetical protein